MPGYDSPSFHALQGFHKLIISEAALQNQLSEIFEISKRQGFNKSNFKKHHSVRLLDTFFSDTFHQDILDDIINCSKEFEYEIKILILNPYSEFAKSRANALKTDPIKEINKALFIIRNGLLKAKGLRKKSDAELNSHQLEESYLFQQIEDIHKIKEEFNLDVKFFNVLTDAPFYIISQFIAKGLILFEKTARDNPWMIFIDDPTQEDDLYDFLSRDFDEIWVSALNLKELSSYRPHVKRYDQRNIFLSHGHNKDVKLQIIEYVEKDLNLQPILFDREGILGKGILENIEELTNQCQKAIIILTKDDVQKSRKTRARQNVIHELGYCQGKYGRKNVAVLIEKGTEIPSNIRGEFFVEFDKDNLDVCLAKLLRHFRPEERKR